MVLTALMLAFTQMGGHSGAVVPAMAAIMGSEIMGTVIMAYFMVGCTVAGLCTWIGVKTGQELIPAAVRLYGGQARVGLACLIALVTLPASAVTGYYWSGLIIHHLTGMAHPLSGLVCLMVFTALAGGRGQEWLKISNTLTLMAAPVLVFLCLYHHPTNQTAPSDWGSINWITVFALTAFHACGTRTLLAVETGAALQKKGREAIILALTAKCIEGVIAVGAVQVAVSANLTEGLALCQAGAVWGAGGFAVMSLFLLSAFTNVMVPAMTVSGRQMTILFGMTSEAGLVTALVLVCALSLISMEVLWYLLSMAGLGSVLFITYTVWKLHKGTGKNS